jgi:osmotically-inducible protein OsmY
VRRSERAARAVAADAQGAAQKVRHPHEEAKEYDDATLAQKVMSEVFRGSEMPKEHVSVNAANGVVSLRGEVHSADMIEELAKRTRRVQGVREVENLLHLPESGTPR